MSNSEQVPLGTLPDSLIIRLRDRYGLRRFVETGTSSGVTALKALRYFPEVHTCELSRESFDRAALPLVDADGKRFIPVCMDSVAFLRGLFPSDVPTLLWLDSHWSGGPKLGPECPLLNELRQIGGTSGRHTILADDYRLFANPPPPPHVAAEWPTLVEIRDLCYELGPTDQFSVEGDIIIVTPGEPAH